MMWSTTEERGASKRKNADRLGALKLKILGFSAPIFVFI